MRLSEHIAMQRLLTNDHGVLSTVHPRRGVDAVPVVYAAGDAAADGAVVGVPIDRVKPKSATRLQRERNLTADPRASLLIQHWDRDDWAALWWVRAELRWVASPTATLESRLADQLTRAFNQYRDAPFDRVLVFDVAGIAGWSASG